MDTPVPLKKLVLQGKVPIYAIEGHVETANDAVRLRREVVSVQSECNLDAIG